MSAPRPKNFEAMVDAWNDPDAFAREVHAYYEQLGRELPSDITEPARSPR